VRNVLGEGVDAGHVHRIRVDLERRTGVDDPVVPLMLGRREIGHFLVSSGLSQPRCGALLPDPRPGPLVLGAVDEVGAGEVAERGREDVDEPGERPHREQDEREQGVQLEAQRRRRHQLGLRLEREDAAEPETRRPRGSCTRRRTAGGWPATVFHMPSTMTVPSTAYMALSLTSSR
jgi:hypothetical protein